MCLSWGGWPNCQMDNEGNWVVCEEGWGQGGYALIERGNNMCGIATDALIPTFSEISPPATTTEDIRDKR